MDGFSLQGCSHALGLLPPGRVFPAGIWPMGSLCKAAHAFSLCSLGRALNLLDFQDAPVPPRHATLHAAMEG